MEVLGWQSESPVVTQAVRLALASQEWDGKNPTFAAHGQCCGTPSLHVALLHCHRELV